MIRDAEHFLSYFNDKNPKLLIIDVHPTWSGHCEALIPFYRNLQTSIIDEFEKRIDIILLDQEKTESLGIPELRSTCQPKILIALQGKFLFSTIGPNTSELEDHIRKNVPYI